jgi:uncharacterized membrane protein YkvI
MDNATMTRKRPIGVSIIAVLVTLGGIITLIAAIYWFFGLGLVIPVIILVYFLADHKVRQAFGM